MKHIKLFERFIYENVANPFTLKYKKGSYGIDFLVTQDVLDKLGLDVEERDQEDGLYYFYPGEIGFVDSDVPDDKDEYINDLMNALKEKMPDLHCVEIE